MNKKIRKLAEKAGFIFWKDEEWKPPNEIIDWSCMYDEELEKFAKLVRADECEKCAEMVDHILKEGGGTYGDAIRARGNQ